MTNMLEIHNLHAEAGGSEILKGVDLVVEEGQTCILFGPNGSGKSTLLSAIMGYSSNRITKGEIIFKGVDITNLPVDERAKMGIGMMMQRPPNVVGVKLGELIKNTAREDCAQEVLEEADDFRMEDFLHRDVNVGFSGGEIKRSELLQLTAQSPELILLDEPESGVDLQSIDLIGNKVRDLLYDQLECRRSAPKKVSALVITHTGQILDYIGADKAYVMGEGRIRCSGRPADLLKTIKTKGYGDCGVCKAIVIPE
ncbi:MAG TPA: ABC transporter ATP-binding protein [Candidatus Methanomethylophilaceae archaeon]|nr:ABC transporter ATP-binding protein [Candidatus Methanomethylophilaceae archaeon]